LKRFKNDDFDISDKKRPAVVEEDKLRKTRKESWKTMEKFRLIYIVLSIFLIVIKKIAKNRQELLHLF